MLENASPTRRFGASIGPSAANTAARPSAAVVTASGSYELPILNLSRLTTLSDEEANRTTRGPSLSPTPSPPSGLDRSGISLDYLTSRSLGDASHDHLVLRRQPSRPRDGGGAKRVRGASSAARFPNLNSQILDDLEFSGWGTSVKLSERDVLPDSTAAAARLDLSCSANEDDRLGSLRGTAISGNAVLGSVYESFYAFPAVVQVAGIWSPLALVGACLVIFLFRPIMCELASALPYNAANYAYLINTTSKNAALLAAALALLDAVTTASVSAGTFAAYLAGEVHLPFDPVWITIIVLAGFTLLCLFGLRETIGMAFAMLCFHMATMTALILAAVVHWARSGNATLVENWHSTPTSAPHIARSLFFGVCIGVLGLTGFECTPMNTELIKPRAYPAVLRNMHYAAFLINAPLMLLVFANLGTSEILSGANVLSLLGDRAAGRWLRIVIVIDAAAVLCGGILTGFLSTSSLLQKLATDRILPDIFGKRLPRSNSLWVSVLVAGALSILVFVSTGASLTRVSQMFAMVFLLDMGLFPLSLLLLKYQRSHLKRSPIVSLEWLILTVAMTLAIILGNIIDTPVSLGYTAAYLGCLGLILLALGQSRLVLVGCLWILDQSWLLHRLRVSKRISQKIARLLRRLRRQPVVYFTKTDSISHLVAAMRYIQKNEPTANVKLCHVYKTTSGIPSELEANHRIVDEAFPAITVDLILIQGSLSPALVSGTASRLGVPLSLVFIGTLGGDSRPPLSMWGGVRVIMR